MKTLPPFFYPDEEIEFKIWGIKKPETPDEIAQFVDELTDAVHAISNFGFYVVYDLGENIIEISSEAIQ